MLSSRLLPDYDSTMRRSFRTLANRRMAATALAIRLYEVDHGRRPASLNDLVPEYLPAVPRDPFAAEDRPITYAPDAAPPVLYSVGEDALDDAGRFELTQGGGVRLDAADLVYFLNGDRPRAKATGAAAASQSSASQTTMADQPPSAETVPDDEH
jgi:hypothetical protein